jgi:hypothetical protein
LIGKSADYLERFARFLIGEYIMANTPNQAVTAPATSAVGSVVEMICGRSLVEAQSSLEEIFTQTAEAEKLVVKGEDARDAADALLLDWLCQWETVDGKSIKMRRARCDIKGEPVLKDGKPEMAFVPIPYPEYKQVIAWATAVYFERGAPTPEAAEKQFQRQCNRLVTLGWSRPKAKNADAERMAAKRAKEAAKFVDKSEGELLELKAKLVEAGDVKSMTEATAITKEIAERAKPEVAKLQADIKLLHDTLKKVASDWAKAGTAESVEKLTAGILAMAK